MIDASTAKKLVIKNDNNKLAQQQFIEIHFAPPRAAFNKAGVFIQVVTEASFNQVFVIDNAGRPVFVKLHDFLRINFKDICNYYSQQASGKTAYDWKVDFMNRYPKTTNETEMAIYWYERVSG